MLAIIPARGGSKGLLGKNIKLLHGKPLISYTIAAAQQAKSITKIVVSTDDPEIAAISKHFGAEVPFLRPKELAEDNSLAIEAYRYTINKISETDECEIKNFVVLLPTSPLRLALDIDNAVGLFETKKAYSVVSYTEEHHPVFWHKKILSDGRFENIFLDNYQVNRQNLGKTFYPNGSIYVFSDEVLHSGHYYTENSFAYIMPRSRSIDIDTIEDFELAEYYLKKYDS